MESNADMSLVKLVNYRRVWDYVHSHGEETIPQISKANGLSLPNVTRAIEYSLAEGIMHSVGIVGGERGRKAQLYSLAPDYMHFVFVSIHSNKLHFEIHDFLLKKPPKKIRLSNFWELLSPELFLKVELLSLLTFRRLLDFLWRNFLKMNIR